MSPLVALFIIAFAPMAGALDLFGNSGTSDTSDAGADSDPDSDTVDPERVGSDIMGGDGVDDTLLGTALNDTLSGLSGNDTLNGLDGDDLIDGGFGDDVLQGRPGDDTLIGGAGDDDLNGNAGDDDMDGGEGDDGLDGGVDNDSLAGGAGADSLRGSDGDDTLAGGNSTSPFDGAADTLLGGAGTDLLFLSDGDFGNGGSEADSFQLSAGETGAITIGDFEVGTDLLVIEQMSGAAISVESQEVTAAGVLVTFDSGATVLLEGLSAALTGDSISFIDAEPSGEEIASPDPTAASFSGTDEDETLEPPAIGATQNADMGGGDDRATGGDLNDTLAGGAGADTLVGALGDDILFSTSADAATVSDSDADSLEGGAGDDTLVLGNGDFAIGGTGADVFALRTDVTTSVTVDDFDIGADALVVEAADPDSLSVLGQSITSDGVVVSLSSGAEIILAGLLAPIDPALIRFEAPGTSTTA